MSAIPFYLYREIRNEIAPVEIEDIDVTIKLANRDTISPIGILRDVEVLRENKIPYLFLVLSSPQDDFCPIIFGRPFLNIVNAKIDCKKQPLVLALVMYLMNLIFPSSVDSLIRKICLVRMKSLVLLLLLYFLLILWNNIC